MISNTLRFGFRPALWTAGGDLSANVLQMLIAGFGLAALIASSAAALTIIKWLGVAYLVWYGIRTFFTTAPPLQRASSAVAPRKLFFQGFFTSAANPEAVFFFAALFPQFIEPSAALWPQLLILGATYLVFDAAILVLMSLGSDRFLGFLRKKSQLLNRLAGAAMITAAALLGTKDIHAR